MNKLFDMRYKDLICSKYSFLSKHTYKGVLKHTFIKMDICRLGNLIRVTFVNYIKRAKKGNIYLKKFKCYCKLVKFLGFHGEKFHITKVSFQALPKEDLC